MNRMVDFVTEGINGIVILSKKLNGSASHKSSMRVWSFIINLIELSYSSFLNWQENVLYFWNERSLMDISFNRIQINYNSKTRFCDFWIKLRANIPKCVFGWRYFAEYQSLKILLLIQYIGLRVRTLLKISYLTLRPALKVFSR